MNRVSARKGIGYLLNVARTIEGADEMRLFPRINLDLPVVMNGKLSGSTATLANLSLGGAFLRGPFPPVRIGDPLFMKYSLPSQGPFEQSGRAVRKEAEGVAVNFYDLDSTSRIKLWKYISEELKNLRQCPYCGHPHAALPSKCTHCEWNLEFHSPEYLDSSPIPKYQNNP